MDIEKRQKLAQELERIAHELREPEPLELSDCEAWSWIPHTEGADRQKEINAYLSNLVDRMPIAPPSAADSTPKEG